MNAESKTSPGSAGFWLDLAPKLIRPANGRSDEITLFDPRSVPERGQLLDGDVISVAESSLVPSRINLGNSL